MFTILPVYLWEAPPSLQVPIRNLWMTIRSRLNILVAFHWTHSSSIMYFSSWEAQNWPQYSRNGLTNGDQRRITYLNQLANTTLYAACYTNALLTHVWPVCLPNLPDPLLYSCCLASWHQPTLLRGVIQSQMQGFNHGLSGESSWEPLHFFKSS